MPVAGCWMWGGPAGRFGVAACSRGPGPGLCDLWTASPVVRRPPHRALGRRWTHQPRQPGAALPIPPPTGPPRPHPTPTKIHATRSGHHHPTPTRMTRTGRRPAESISSPAFGPDGPSGDRARRRRSRRRPSRPGADRVLEVLEGSTSSMRSMSAGRVTRNPVSVPAVQKSVVRNSTMSASVMSRPAR